MHFLKILDLKKFFEFSNEGFETSNSAWQTDKKAILPCFGNCNDHNSIFGNIRFIINSFYCCELIENKFKRCEYKYSFAFLLTINVSKYYAFSIDYIMFLKNLISIFSCDNIFAVIIKLHRRKK